MGSKKTTDSLNDVLEAINRERNPLKELLFSPELVRRLSNQEALIIATNGVYKALMMQYHPDRSVSENSTNSDNTDLLTRFRAAREKILHDPLTARQEYLSDRRIKKVDTSVNNSMIESRKILSRDSVQDSPASRLFEAFMSHETIKDIDSARILFQPIQLKGKNQLLSVQTDHGKSSLTLMEYDNSFEFNQEFLEYFNDIENKTGYQPVALYVSKKSADIVSQEGHLIGVERDELRQYAFEEGWYQVKGEKSAIRDFRSLIHFKPLDQKSQPVQLFGSVSPEDIERKNGFKKLNGFYDEADIVYGALGQTVGQRTIPAWEIELLIPNGKFTEILNEGLLKPIFEPTAATIGELKNGRKLILGQAIIPAVTYRK